MVPLVARVQSCYQVMGRNLPRDIEFVAPSEFVGWDETVERDWSLRYWSEKFKETLRQDYLSQGQVDARGVFVFPATHHPSGSG